MSVERIFYGRSGTRSFVRDYWVAVEDDRLGPSAAMGHSTNASDDDPDRYAENEDWANELPDLDPTEETESGA